jgi:hypothetical protein
MKRSFSDPTLYDAYEYNKLLYNNIILDVSFSFLQPYPVIYGDSNWVTGVGSNPAHINNMVQNKMFYLLSQGGSQNNVTVSGIGIHKAANIAYRAMCVYSDINTTWSDSRDNFYDAAKDLYGINSCEARETRNAWAAVGIGTASYESCNPPVSATISGSLYLCNDDNETYTANPSGGTGVYSYNWYVDYGNGWYHVSSFSSVTLWGYNNPPDTDLELKLVVTSGTEQCTVYKSILVYDCGYRSFNVYPNPANDILNISIPADDIGDALSFESKKDAVNVSIMNSMGDIYYSGSYYSTDFTIPVGDIPEGLNIISVRIGDKRYSKHVIFSH